MFIKGFNATYLALGAMVIFWTGCGADGENGNDESCQNGSFQCAGGLLEQCNNGVWGVFTECDRLGLECTVLNGTAQCAEIQPTDADSDADSDSDADTDSDTDSDSDTDADGDTDSSGDADTDTDGDTDGDADGDADTDADADTDSDTDADADSESDSGTEKDTESASESDSATDSEPDTGTENVDTEPEIPECGSLDTTVDSNVTLGIFINHVGYDVNGAKVAVVEASGNLSRFQVVDGGNTVVACGDLAATNGFTEWGGGPSFYTADFTYLAKSGTYRLLVNGAHSEPFEVAEHLLLRKTAREVVSYFNLSRADHDAIWAADEAIRKIGEDDATYDVRGGWYDASGDVSKYLSHLSYANFLNPQQIPLVAWALSYAYDTAGDALDNLGIGAEVLDEAVWGADYLVRVLDPDGYFYINVFDGWSGYTDAREICAFSGEGGARSGDFQAAFREGGGMSVAALARISTLKHDGAFSSDRYLEAAQKGFAHLEANNINYCDDGKENVIDDYTALMAASELFAATSDDEYLDAARYRATNLISRLDDRGYFIADSGSRPFWHGSDAGLPVIALSRYATLEPDDGKKTKAANAIRTHLEYLLTVADNVPNPYGYARQTFISEGSMQDGFFIPHDNETEYWWQGENARLSSLAAAALIGGRITDMPKGKRMGVPYKLAVFAANQVDWVMGKNPRDVCFMHGVGRNNPPPYTAEKVDYGQGAHTGGISNGITGGENNVNGSGIDWLPGVPREDWNQPAEWYMWRWVEQWLPHAAWYLVAISAMAEE